MEFPQGVKGGKGGSLWPDLAQREGVNGIYCPALSSHLLQLVFDSAFCQVAGKSQLTVTMALAGRVDNLTIG